MAERRHKGTLPIGIKVGEELHTDFEIRSLPASRMFKCAREAEELEHVIVALDDKMKPIYRPAYVESPALMSQATLLARLVRIGDLKGPFDADILDDLDELDSDEILATIRMMDSAVPEEALEMGRPVTPGADDTPGGEST